MQQQKSHTSRSLTRLQEQKNQKIITDPIPEEELQPNNTIDVDQVANGASSTVSQSGGDGNSATVAQYVEGHISTVNQIGNGNSAVITQGTIVP